MVYSCLNILPLYYGYLRRSFTSSGLSFQSVQIDPQTLIYFWGPQPGFFTDKPSLVLINGFVSVSIWQWQHQVPYLAPYFDLYIPDLVFLGQSTTTSLDRTVEFQAECLIKLLKKIGLRRYHVLGHSYGGFVAYHMARLWPEKVGKVVLVSSAINRKSRDQDDLLELTKMENMEDLILPKTPHALRLLMAVTMKRQLPIPVFILNNFFHVSFF
ncbi:hypothetical protein GIB67_024143 [Kingdonia uniflora]|uniref:AB hydrolase-1 domain-containing protein n=1 Tax=Kingdonia uniflora TaxID=39325 RepID=A0A7J7L0L0_9MAGN|nr:hypothetical protein GIB67_024143 [Kingdonia uniflora]